LQLSRSVQGGIKEGGGEKEEDGSYGNSYCEDEDSGFGRGGESFKRSQQEEAAIIMQYLHQQQWRDHIMFMLKKDELICDLIIQLIERM